MESVYQCESSGLNVLLIKGLGNERDTAEREILAAGVPLALPHRQVWANALSAGDSWFLVVRDKRGRGCGGIALEKLKSRALPGHAILRVDKFGGDLPGEVVEALLKAIRNVARKTPRLLRLHLNVFSRSGKVAIGEMLSKLGFREIIPPHSSRYTLVIDLRPSEAEVFEGLGKSVRKRIRETQKTAMRMQVVTDPMYAERLGALQSEALKRTGGPAHSEDWKRILRFSLENPSLSQIIGSFLTDDLSPGNMAAFVWVWNNGDHAEYRSAGSTRISESRVVLGYPLVWEMIRFARANGSEWFDMGGVTLEEEGSSSMKGISDFKRHFSRELVEIGAEWVYEPSAARAEIAEMVSKGAKRIRGLIKIRS